MRAASTEALTFKPCSDVPSQVLAIAMPNETATPRVTAAPLPERVAANFYLFYMLIEPGLFIELLREAS